MQCALIQARVFALRQAFAGFASGKILKRFAEAAIGRRTRRGAAAVASTATRSHVQLRLVVNVWLRRLQELNRNPDRGPHRKRQRGEDRSHDGQHAHETAGADCGRGGDGTKIVEMRDMAANAGKPANEIEREQRHGLSPGGNDRTSPWPQSGAWTLSRRKVVRS